MVERSGYPLLVYKAPTIPLPVDWPKYVKTGILHVISLAQMASTAARAHAAKKRGIVARLRAELEEAQREISLLEEELRLKDLRMGRVKPRKRPHCRGIERMAILELKASRGWSKAQTADRLLLRSATIAAWMKRIDEEGENALVKTAAPINRFPDFVRHIVCRLKVLCPMMGKKRIAQTLARSGLYLCVTTVRRMLQEREGTEPTEAGALARESVRDKVRGSPVRAREPNHAWQTDLTVVPTGAGFWTPWLPFSIVQRWPFSWWVACVVDHYSRRVMGFTVFSKEPKSVEVRTFLGRLVKRHGAPTYIISDKGPQFDCAGFRTWCHSKGIEPRYASTGSLRATAIIERFFLSLKEEWLRRILVPLRRDAIRRELSCYFRWFEQHRPHQGLGGRTPKEVYDGLPETGRETKMETLKPPTIPRLDLVVRFHENRRQLPIVEIKRAA